MKNRKRHTSAVRFGVAVKTVLLCALLAAAGVGYVGLKNQIHRLSQDIVRKEKQLEQLRTENARQARQLATLRAPPFLHARAAELSLGLVPPQPSQIVRLPEPHLPPGAGATSAPADLAARLQLADGAAAALPAAPATLR
ncbi:hypothetical protein NXS98_09790 [Fontisphaera persica]|uniref:hypothetical protein n=1 Tax=Fontisphaera persica TaxID=2974023 RepID=UPI0024C0D70C|nr:hypothetical protein [Fontisphaera persica]WCJ58019.1 hypothetical protein NXS98_09790 [Fontisphaera persica]